MIEYNRDVLAKAMLAYCWDTGKLNIDMTDFAKWCKNKRPEASEELEKLAANIFNKGMLGGANNV